MIVLLIFALLFGAVDAHRYSSAIRECDYPPLGVQRNLFANQELQHGLWTWKSPKHLKVPHSLIAEQELQSVEGQKMLLYAEEQELYLVLWDSERCQAEGRFPVTNLNLLDGYKVPTLSRVEEVDVTGDGIEELYVAIALEEKGNLSSVSRVINQIYQRKDSGWHELFFNEQCLRFSSFEFRRSQQNGEIVNLIYTDNDIHCRPPLSNERYYRVLLWNGNALEDIETGIVHNPVWHTNPAWYGWVCILGPNLAVVGLVAFAIARVTMRRLRH